MANLDDDTQMSSSSDEESESNNDSKKEGSLNMAGFLFGNIDRDGHLEENFLDEASKKKLGGLSSMLGLGNIIQDEVKNAAESNVKVEDYEAGNKASVCCIVKDYEN
jgi:hypothetical protein